MSVYVLLLFMTVLLLPITRARIKDSDKIYIFCAYTILWIFMGTRGSSVGTDTSMGKYIFLVESSLPWQEINITYLGWSAMCKIVGLFDGGYILFQALISGIIVYSVARFIYYYSKDIVFSTYLFVCTYTYCTAFNAMRQMCAVAFVLQAAVEIIKNRKKFALALWVIACTIHFTAVASVPILWVLLKSQSIDLQRMLKKLIIITTLIVILSEQMINLAQLVAPHYKIYIGTNLSARGRTIIIQFLYLLILIVGWTTYCHTDISELKGVILISFISICIGIVGARNVLFIRMNAYYSVFLICAIPNIIRKIMLNKESVFIANLCIGIILFIPYVIQLKGNYSNVVPYLFYK